MASFDGDLNTLLSNIVFTEISNCSKICYAPNIGKYIHNLKTATSDYNIDDTKKFKFPILNSTTTLYLLRLYQQVDDLDIAKKILIVIGMNIYGSLFRKHFKFCDPTRMRYALSRIRSSNMFKQKGVGNSIMYWAGRILTRYGLKPNDDKIVKMYMEFRTSISQSLKSISAAYYTYDPNEIAEQQQVSEYINAIAGKVANRIVTESLDKEVLIRCIRKVGIDAKLGTDIIKQCTHDGVFSKEFIVLMLMGIDNKDNVCMARWYQGLVQRAYRYEYNPLSVILTKQSLKTLNIAEFDLEDDPKKVVDYTRTLKQDQQMLLQQTKRLILNYYYQKLFSYICH